MSWRVVGANFDQMHMNHNVELAADHPDVEVVALCDEDPAASTGSMSRAAEEIGLAADRQYDDFEACLAATDPDIVLLGPANADHAAYVERAAQFEVHAVLEKPFADTLAGADRMIDVYDDRDERLAVNWPSTWSPTTRTAKELVADGAVGAVQEVEYYIGHAGPPRDSWFYDAAAGGGSMLDFAGYAVVNTTWFRGGTLPESVLAETYVPAETDVDTRSVLVADYGGRFSTYQTTWERHAEFRGHPQRPLGGFTIVGTDGTLSTQGVDEGLRLQNDDHPDGTIVDPDPVEPPHENAVQYLVDRIERGKPLTGPTAPGTSRKAQQVLEAARRSVRRDERVPVPE